MTAGAPPGAAESGRDPLEARRSREVLRLEDLRVVYETEAGSLRAVDGVELSVRASERLGIVGESGSGKSTLGLALINLLRPPGRVESGKAYLEGVDLLSLDTKSIRSARFSRIAMIPQGAMNSLNPVMRIKELVLDTLRAHRESVDWKELSERFNVASSKRDRDFVGPVLQSVDLRPEVGEMYPHELSGGMKQRVTIAIATMLAPRVIIADEPTSALDVVVQREVMATLERAASETGAAVILIGHDMGLMAQFADRIAVMYSGRIVEEATMREIFSSPVHPYTELLISSVPRLGVRGELKGIPGTAPSLLNPPSGCRFHPRCPFREHVCTGQVPELRAVGRERKAACWVRARD